MWCSDACRRAAHTERLAAARAGLAVRIVEVPRASAAARHHTAAARPPAVPPRELTPAELVRQTLDDPGALQLLLDALTTRAKAKKLDRKLRAECLELARVLLPNASRY